MTITPRTMSKEEADLRAYVERLTIANLNLKKRIAKEQVTIYQLKEALKWIKGFLGEPKPGTSIVNFSIYEVVERALGEKREAE